MTRKLDLTPEKALIFRISHVENLNWALKNGLHCRSSAQSDPDFVRIGNRDLIERRDQFQVTVGARGTLSDYIPFYFTPWTPMLFNIVTGHRDVPKVDRDNIVFFVASLHEIAEASVPFVFTDQHAVQMLANFSATLDDLDRIDWDVLSRRDRQGRPDIRRDPDDPGKLLRVQAEALIHGHLPAQMLKGIVCHSERVRERFMEAVGEVGVESGIVVRPHWYFND